MNAGPNTDGNVKEVVPFFGVTSMGRSLRFYVDGLGFTMKHKWVVDGNVRWCWLTLGGAALMLQEFLKERLPAGKLGEGMSLCFTCQDAIAIYREARARGLEVQEPFVGNAMWVTGLTDPDGYRIYFESVTDAPEETKLSDVQG